MNRRMSDKPFRQPGWEFFIPHSNQFESNYHDIAYIEFADYYKHPLEYKRALRKLYPNMVHYDWEVLVVMKDDGMYAIGKTEKRETAKHFALFFADAIGCPCKDQHGNEYKPK